jgi:addiction module HigA family antidote
MRQSGFKESHMPMYNPAHPGLVLKDALEGAGMNVTNFAAHIGVSRVTLSRILNCRAGITPEMSIKLSQAFGQNQPDIWFLMQNAHDFWQASHARRKAVRPLKLAA